MTQAATIDAPLIKTIFIAAPRERVWDYLTRKEHIAKWYQERDADLAPDADYTLRRGNGERVVWGKVTDWSRPERLVTTFEVEPLEGRATTVTWTLHEVPGGTRVVLTHAGIVDAQGRAATVFGHLDAGWDAHFASLRKAVA